MLHRFLTWRDHVDHHLLELLSGSSLALILKIIGAGLAFAFNVLLARTLGTEGAGLYFLSLSIITVAVVFGRMGLDKAVLRFISANSAICNWSAVKGVQRKATIIAVTAAAGATATIFLLAPWLANTIFGKPELVILLRWMVIAIIPMTINFVYSHMLKGRKLIFNATLIENVGVATISLLVFYTVGRNFSVVGAIWSYVLAAMVTAVIGIYFWNRYVPQIHTVPAIFDTHTIFISSLPLFWVAFTTWIINHFGNFALGIWSTTAEVGIFGIASRLAFFVSFTLVAVNSIAAPKFAALHQQNDRKALTKTAHNAIRLTTLAASPLVILYIIAPKWVMGIFGAEFVAGSSVLIILTLAQFVNAATGPVELLLIMSGRERLVRTNVMIVGAMSILLYLWLVPNFGAMGAAIAFATGLMVKNLVSVWLVYEYLEIKLYYVNGGK